MAAMGSSRSQIVISDDDNEPVVPPPLVAASTSSSSGAAHDDLQRRPAEEASGSGSGGGDGSIRRPKWLPDCFSVGVEYRRSDGSVVILDYTCPAGLKFNLRSRVEEYCSSGALQRAIDAKATLQDKTTLQVGNGEPLPASTNLKERKKNLKHGRKEEKMQWLQTLASHQDQGGGQAGNLN